MSSPYRDPGGCDSVHRAQCRKILLEKAYDALGDQSHPTFAERELVLAAEHFISVQTLQQIVGVHAGE